MKSQSRVLLVIVALVVAVAPSASARSPRALPGTPTADGRVTYELPTGSLRPSAVLRISRVAGASRYTAICQRDGASSDDRAWSATSFSPTLWIKDLRYGDRMQCFFVAENGDGESYSDYWYFPVMVDLPLPTKITLKNTIEPGRRYRVAWTERLRIPNWAPRVTYVTVLPRHGIRPIARTRVTDKLQRAAFVRIPASTPPGRYRICVTIENDIQGGSSIPRASCALRTIADPNAGGSSGGGSSGGGPSGGGESGGSSGATGQFGSPGPVVV